MPSSAGTYRTATDLSCTPCPAGEFGIYPGQQGCMTVQQGTYTDTVGSTQPTPCPAGALLCLANPRILTLLRPKPHHQPRPQTRSHVCSSLVKVLCIIPPVHCIVFSCIKAAALCFPRDPSAGQDAATVPVHRQCKGFSHLIRTPLDRACSRNLAATTPTFPTQSADAVKCASGTAAATFLNNDISDCVPCAAGSYAAQNGSVTCTPCSAGEQAPRTSRLLCGHEHECRLENIPTQAALISRPLT